MLNKEKSIPREMPTFIKRPLVPELVVDFLIKNNNSSVHVDNPDVIRATRIVLDETNDAAGSFVPSTKEKQIKTAEIQTML